MDAEISVNAVIAAAKTRPLCGRGGWVWEGESTEAQRIWHVYVAQKALHILFHMHGMALLFDCIKRINSEKR